MPLKLCFLGKVLLSKESRLSTPEGNGGTPPLGILFYGNHTTDVPIQTKHLGIGGHHRPVLGLPDAYFDTGQQIAVAFDDRLVDVKRFFHETSFKYPSPSKNPSSVFRVSLRRLSNLRQETAYLSHRFLPGPWLNLL
jgi:hypothetical protein